MKKVLEFPGCILAHTVSGTTHLLSGSRELTDLMDGDCFDDACMDEGMKTLPTDPGVYSATIEYWFSQGYFEGYPAPGESDYDFMLSNLQRIDLSRTPAPAEVEELLERYKSSWWLLGYEAASHEDYEISEENWAKMNALKSCILAAFSNTTPYLSGDVKGWLPIETAPKDGTRIMLGYFPDYMDGKQQGGHPQIAWWNDTKNLWCSGLGFLKAKGAFSPTHWMPLPEPPDRKAGE